MKRTRSTRRHFLKQTTVLGLSTATLPVIIPASALGRAGAVAPNNRISVGCIGVGPQGQGDMHGFLNQKDAQVLAVCDVGATICLVGPLRSRAGEHSIAKGRVTPRRFGTSISNSAPV